MCLQAEEAPKKEEKTDRPKSPGFLAKILAPFKNGEKKTEKKVKEKTKKSEKKEEVCYLSFFLCLSLDGDSYPLPRLPPPLLLRRHPRRLLPLRRPPLP